jgi:tRNA(Ile)-lysidine synthase
MALAALCSRLQSLVHSDHFQVHRQDHNLSLLKPLNFRAFIVDHGLRAGSQLEAENVSRILEERGNSWQMNLSFPS